MGNVIKFGTDGWRAIIADQFTFANVERVAYAVGIYVKETYQENGFEQVPILIGYDTRFLADRFAVRAGEVLIGMGLKAKLSARDVPTPAIAWATQCEPTAGAMQFTASHNPPEYCGIKYIPHYAGPATDDITSSIVSHLKDFPEDHVIKPVDVPKFDPRSPYLTALTKLVDLERIGGSGLKIGYDALYSTSRGYLDRILSSAGLRPTVLHDWRDTQFGGGMPEPKPEYLTELIAKVTSQKLDLGVATDGDADRFAVIDELGNYFPPNQLLCLLVRHLVKNKGMKGAVVRTVATTHLLDKLANLYGLELIETPVGFKYVGEKMRGCDVLLGGEESGGVSVKGHIPEKDGILANLLLIEMVAYEAKPLSQIWQDLTEEAGMSFIGRRADLHLNHQMQNRLMDKLTNFPIKTLAGQPVARIGRLDGLKLYLDDSNWMLIRPSGTEPMIRLYFEGTSARRADEMVADFNHQIETIMTDLFKSELTTSASKVAVPSVAHQ